MLGRESAEVSVSKVRRICREEDWDVCQIGLELGFEFTDTQLRSDAVWSEIQDIPQGWVKKEEWEVAHGHKSEAAKWMTKQVEGVLNAHERRVRKMLPDDHPEGR